MKAVHEAELQVDGAKANGKALLEKEGAVRCRYREAHGVEDRACDGERKAHTAEKRLFRDEADYERRVRSTAVGNGSTGSVAQLECRVPILAGVRGPSSNPSKQTFKTSGLIPSIWYLSINVLYYTIKSLNQRPSSDNLL